MKPFWVGFQLTLGIIAACLAIPVVLLLIGLAQVNPQVWSALLAPVFVGAVAVIIAAIGGVVLGVREAARKARHS